MAEKKPRRRRKRGSSDPEVSPEQMEWYNRRNILLTGGVTGLGIGLMVAFSAYESEGPLLAVGIGALVAVAIWFGFWVNYGRKK